MNVFRMKPKANRTRLSADTEFQTATFINEQCYTECNRAKTI